VTDGEFRMRPYPTRLKHVGYEGHPLSPSWGPETRNPARSGVSVRDHPARPLNPPPATTH
jgi:hypothetical protein